MARIARPNRAGGALLAAAFALAAMAAGCRASHGQIRLDAGIFDIRAVELTDRLPKDCPQPSPSCNVAEDGYAILQLVLVPRDADASSDKKGEIDLFKLSEQAVVVASDGSAHERWMAGNAFNDARGVTEYQVAFVVPESSTSFELRWPGNEALKLNSTPDR